MKWRNFKTILTMQLHEKLDLSFFKHKQKLLFKTAGAILGFAAVTAVAYFVLWLCQTLNIFAAVNHIPVTVISVILTVILWLNLVTCTIGISKTLYYAADNQMLITYPVNPNLLFLSKLTGYYLQEYVKAYTLVIPIFFAYGILSGYPWIYYLWVPLIFILITAIPVLLGGILSLPAHFLIYWLQRYRVVKLVLLSLILVTLFLGTGVLINQIPENINLIRIWALVAAKIRAFLITFNQIWAPFYWLTLAICGTYTQMRVQLWTPYTWQVPLVLLLSIAALIALNLLVARPCYLRLMTRNLEFAKKTPKHYGHNHRHPAFIATYLYETKRHLRNPNITTVTLSTIMIAPLAVLLLNKIYAAMATRLLGAYLTMAFNILVILLLTLAHNLNVSTIFSNDGPAWPLNKTKPQSPIQILIPRLLYHGIISLILITIMTGIFSTFAALTWPARFCCWVLLASVTLAHLLWSAEIDFLHPQQQNANEAKAIILCFALSGFIFVWSFFLLTEGRTAIWLRLALTGIALLVWRCWSFIIKTQTLFREI